MSKERERWRFPSGSKPPLRTALALAIVHQFKDNGDMNIGWVYKDREVIELPPLTAVIQKEAGWYVSTCPELAFIRTIVNLCA